MARKITSRGVCAWAGAGSDHRARQAFGSPMGAVAGALSGWPEVAPRGWDEATGCPAPGLGLRVVGASTTPTLLLLPLLLLTVDG